MTETGGGPSGRGGMDRMTNLVTNTTRRGRTARRGVSVVTMLAYGTVGALSAMTVTTILHWNTAVTGGAAAALPQQSPQLLTASLTPAPPSHAAADEPDVIVAVEQAVRSGSVEVQDDVFMPPLAIAEPPAAPQAPESPASLMALPREDVLSPEALRIIANMTPEQIDAVTLLLLSRVGNVGNAGGVPPVEEAPWIGDWGDDPGDGAAMSEVGQPAAVLPEPWRFAEEPDGTLSVKIPEDAFSRIVVQPGMVIAGLGEIAAVETSGDEAAVRFTDGRRLAAPRHPTALQAERERLVEARTNAARLAALQKPAAEEESAEPAPPAAMTRNAAPAASGALAGGGADGAARETWIQVASFRQETNAADAEKTLRDKGFTTRVFRSGGATPWHVVQVRPAGTPLDSALRALRALGFLDAYVVNARLVSTVE